jgi:hypothetical protein
MDIDYEVYAEGEALLGWLNATVQVRGAAPFDGNAWLTRLAERCSNGYPPREPKSPTSR